MKYYSEAVNFKLNGTPIKIEPYGMGHINETYYLETDKGAKYIIQKINSKLFKDIERLMRNIELVTLHISKKVQQSGGNVDREVLQIVYTKDNKTFFSSENGFFRVYVFIDKATSHQLVTNPEHFYQSAYAFGNFQKQLSDFDASLLYEVLPNFHNTRVRFENFKAALAKDEKGRAASVREEIEFVLSREKYCDKIVDLLSSGKMPLRVTHNDTKLNNVMIDDATDKGIAVIDLDTVMPGSSCYDFGDSIRFGCNPAPEDERDLSKVNFRLDLFEVYTKGYVSALGERITPIEKENLPFGSILMTYECGVRFLTDYLNGDTYFKIHREHQNLDRARTQFKLVSDMEALTDKMLAIVNKY